jgi:hypothetical protein
VAKADIIGKNLRVIAIQDLACSLLAGTGCWGACFPAGAVNQHGPCGGCTATTTADPLTGHGLVLNL